MSAVMHAKECGCIPDGLLHGGTTYVPVQIQEYLECGTRERTNDRTKIVMAVLQKQSLKTSVLQSNAKMKYISCRSTDSTDFVNQENF